jgi:hypothetical protein
VSARIDPRKLGAAARAQIEAASHNPVTQPAGEVVSRKRKRPKAGTDVFDGWCCGCGLRIVGKAAMERHSDETKHRRFSCLPLSTPPRAVP